MFLPKQNRLAVNRGEATSYVLIVLKSKCGWQNSVTFGFFNRLTSLWRVASLTLFFGPNQGSTIVVWLNIVLLTSKILSKPRVLSNFCSACTNLNVSTADTDLERPGSGHCFQQIRPVSYLRRRVLCRGAEVSARKITIPSFFLNSLSTTTKQTPGNRANRKNMHHESLHLRPKKRRKLTISYIFQISSCQAKIYYLRPNRGF